MPESPYGYWLPPDISTHGAKVDNLIAVLHWFMAIIFVVWGVFFVYCLIRFRARPGVLASYDLPKARLAILAIISIAVIEGIIDVGLSVPVWARAKELTPDAEDALEIHVIAEQFAWNFHYPGADGKFGRTAPELMEADNLIGLDRDDPNAADDVVTNNDLRIPVNRPIVCQLTSKDVIHSFFIPVLRVKQDVNPGMRIPLWFEAVKTGDYQVACAQLCGNNHYNMKGDLTIYTAEEFEAWYADMAGDDDEEEEEEDD